MKPKMGVFSDIYSLDAPEEVFMIYQFNKLLNILFKLKLLFSWRPFEEKEALDLSYRRQFLENDMVIKIIFFFKLSFVKK